MSFGDPSISLPSEEELASMIKLTMRSGQKEWVTNLRDFALTQIAIAKNFLSDYNAIVEKVFNAAFDQIILSMLPLVPLDTGRLRAGFVNAFSLHIGTNIVGNVTDLSTIEFDLAKLLSEVPYARYFISELTGKEFIEVPTTAGTTPIELHIIRERMRFIPIEVSFELKAKGWDTRLITEEGELLGVITGDNRLGMRNLLDIIGV